MNYLCLVADLCQLCPSLYALSLHLSGFVSSYYVWSPKTLPGQGAVRVLEHAMARTTRLTASFKTILGVFRNCDRSIGVLLVGRRDYYQTTGESQN
jgi:hypothetical protein